MDIFTREELVGMTSKQVNNLAKYYGVDKSSETLIDDLLAKINIPHPEYDQSSEPATMSAKVARILEGIKNGK